MSCFARCALRAISLVCALASTAACATVTRGVHQPFNVETVPSGASVKTSNGFACDQTPCSFRMQRKSEFYVTITKDGYQTWTGQVTHAVSGAGGAGLAGNVIFGGITGATVDFVSGAMMDLKPNPLKVTLEKQISQPTATPPTPRAAQ